MHKTRLERWALWAPLLVLAAAAWGCAPTWNRAPAGPAVETRPAAPEPLLDPSAVEARIAELEKVLEEDLQEDKERALRRLLEDYRNALACLRGPARPEDERRLAEALFRGLTRLEQGCLEIPGRIPCPAPSEVAEKISAYKESIMNAYVAWDYRTVLSRLEELETDFGPKALSPDLGVIKAVSLAEQGETAEALRLAEELIPKMQTRPGLALLRSRMVSWYLKRDRPEEARAQYEKLVDEIQDARSALARAEREVFPGAAPGDFDRMGAPRVELPEEEPPGEIREVIREVDRLIREGAFHEAKLLLVKHRIRNPGEEAAGMIDRAMERVERAEEAVGGDEPEQTREPDSGPGEALMSARRHIEQEDYEAALESIREMEEKGEASSRTLSGLREEAVEKLINKEREKAARLYLRARNTKDEKEKGDLLASSYKILKGLLERFPASTLAGKLERNLETVRSEMKSLGISPPGPGS